MASRLLRLNPGVNSHSAFYTSSPGESAYNPHPHFTPLPPPPTLPALLRSSTCLQASQSTAFVDLKSSTQPFSGFSSVLSHIQLSCCLLTRCPALTHPSMLLPSTPILPTPLTSAVLDVQHYFTHFFFKEPPRLQPDSWQMLIR